MKAFKNLIEFVTRQNKRFYNRDIKCPVMLNEIEEAYYEGYHQAEKDLELTYDDICEIMEIREDVLEMDSYENLYEEILKRFKDFKERKEK